LKYEMIILLAQRHKTLICNKLINVIEKDTSKNDVTNEEMK